MQEMKHFLEQNSTFGKAVLIVVTVISLAAAIAMSMTMTSFGMPLPMLTPVEIPLLLMAAFCIWALKKSLQSFPNWWDSLTPAQQDDYLQDYAYAEKMNDILILGQRYAYIHHIGQPIAYTDIAEIDFRHSRSGSIMFVYLRDGRKMATGVPAFTDRAALADLLLERCNRF